jgi:ubiquinone/menaquinone biosynthesis C-methylase UbiE
MNTFDLVAPFYDTLTKAVFGKSIRMAQTLYLPSIPPKAKVLILGGGTGWLLRKLLDINPSCSVCYIDASAKMIEISKNKIADHANEVVFIHGNENAIPPDVKFDAVITHFYLDLFSTADCDLVIQKIRASLREKSIWLVADFINTTWWHSAMLKLMYMLFKMITTIQADELPAWYPLLEKNGFIKAGSQKFYNGFIASMMYRSESIPEKI